MAHPDLLPITSKQLNGWLAFNRIECIGDERADLRNGILISNLLAPHMKKGKNPPKPTAFMPFYIKPKATPDEIHRVIAGALRGAKRGSNNRQS